MKFLYLTHHCAIYFEYNVPKMFENVQNDQNDHCELFWKLSIAYDLDFVSECKN